MEPPVSLTSPEDTTGRVPVAKEVYEPVEPLAPAAKLPVVPIV